MKVKIRMDLVERIKSNLTNEDTWRTRRQDLITQVVIVLLSITYLI